MLGILLGLILAVKQIVSSEEKKAVQRPPTQPSINLIHTPPQLPTVPPYIPTSVTFRTLSHSVPDILRDAAREAELLRATPRPPRYPQATNETVNGKSLLENWRNSILGLVRLAESNLQFAKSQAIMMNHRAAAEAAATSVENLSRALLHCYGEKPDLNAGQEEPLRLLARRFQGDERARFEKAIDEAAQLCRNKIVQAYLSEKGIQAPLLSGTRTHQIIETAMKIGTQFRQIIDEHFATEIPELRERCPKCGALNIGVWSFNAEGSAYQCNVCSHKWIQPTH